MVLGGTAPAAVDEEGRDINPHILSTFLRHLGIMAHEHRR